MPAPRGRCCPPLSLCSHKVIFPNRRSLRAYGTGSVHFSAPDINRTAVHHPYVPPCFSPPCHQRHQVGLLACWRLVCHVIYQRCAKVDIHRRCTPGLSSQPTPASALPPVPSRSLDHTSGNTLVADVMGPSERSLGCMRFCNCLTDTKTTAPQQYFLCASLASFPRPLRHFWIHTAELQALPSRPSPLLILHYP